VNVRFIPSATGPQTADLSLFGQAIAAVVVHLQGTGIATSNSVYAQPVGGTNTFYTFAGTTPAVSAIPTTSGIMAYFVLYNNSLLPVSLGSGPTLFTGSDVGFAALIGRPADFSVTKATTTGAGVACGTGNLAPAGFCTFAVTFKPLAWDAVAGVGTRTRWAAVSVGTNNILGVIGQVQQLDLSITPTTPPVFSGTPPATTITVKNNGGQATQLLRESISPVPSVFVIADDTCYGRSLAAGGTCTVTVTFTGTISVTTAQTASLTVTDGTANNTVSVAMSVGGP
jgi:hypothetical protein